MLESIGEFESQTDHPHDGGPDGMKGDSRAIESALTHGLDSRHTTIQYLLGHKALDCQTERDMRHALAELASAAAVFKDGGSSTRTWRRQ